MHKNQRQFEKCYTHLKTYRNALKEGAITFKWDIDVRERLSFKPKVSENSFQDDGVKYCLRSLSLPPNKVKKLISEKVQLELKVYYRGLSWQYPKLEKLKTWDAPWETFF